MLDRACGLPATTGLTNYTSDVNLGECAKCHVGRYLPVMEGFFASMFSQMGVADPQGQATQLVNGGLDCLICHAEEYRSHPTDGILADDRRHGVAGRGVADARSGSARDSRDNADFDHDGQPDLVHRHRRRRRHRRAADDRHRRRRHARHAVADRRAGPQPAGARVHRPRPNEHTCLRCHEHARTGYKRGTLFVEGHDVHAAPRRPARSPAPTNQCTVCHTYDDHKFVRGHMVGGDLAAADYPPPPPGTAPDPNDPTDLTCQTCHDAADLPRRMP